MHVLQWIAIQAENKDHAFRSVKDYLESQMGDEYNLASWYDWFVAGGGRWNPNPDSQYDDDDQSMVISHAEEPDLFEERILLAMESRKQEFDNYAKDVDPEIIAKVISDYNPREKNFMLFSSLYPIKKVIDMAYGNWDYNSYFFDMVNDTTSPAYVFESIDKGDKDWYIVPVDFHF
jgi:hypothetical protein